MKKIFIALSLCSVLTACNKYLDMTPRDSISDKVMWTSVESAEYAVNSIYSYSYDIFANWPSAVGITEAFTDEFKYGSYVNFAYCLIPSQVAYGGTNLTNSFVTVYLGCWSSLYDAIRRTNEALSNLKTLGTALPEGDRTRLEGELRLMRGWLYFELVKRYKEVILYDEDLSAISVEKALSSEADGWKFIKDDLTFAVEALPEKSAAKGRLDKGVAYALISRAMLYAGDNDAVIAAADALAGLGYSLMADYASVFTVPVQSGNPESILQYSFSYADNVTHEFDFYYTPGGDYKLVGQQGGGAPPVGPCQLLGHVGVHGPRERGRGRQVLDEVEQPLPPQLAAEVVQRPARERHEVVVEGARVVLREACERDYSPRPTPAFSLSSRHARAMARKSS